MFAPAVPVRWLALAAAASLVLAACSGAASPTWTFPPDVAPAAAPAVASTGTLEFEAWDLGFTPTTPVVPAAGTYEIVLRNTGTVVHNIAFADGTVIEAQPGATATGSIAVPESGVVFVCNVPGHEAAGMKGAISVANATVAADDHGGPAPVTSVEADPDASPPVRYDPAAPPALTGKVHDIDLEMIEKEMTIATGYVQKVWTFGGTVPGPVLRVKLGDAVRIHLKNPATNQLSHSIDFHASFVAWNDEMTSIEPGKEKLYEFVASRAGVFMYHCGTAPALHHIANGMYGMIIVEPKGGLGPADVEIALVQSEWYLGPQGAETDLAKASEAAPAPDFVLFNGVANQYKDGPIEVPTGARVRVFILDAGPSIDSSFHVVGTVFDRVIKEGLVLEPDNPGGWGSQAVDLSPAQGAIVEMVFAEDGFYPIVTHAFNFVGRGALGLFKAGDGDPLD